MSISQMSRRKFLKVSVIAGITVYLAPLQSKAFAELFQQGVLEKPQWDSATRKVRYRVDGKSKVRGEKVFSYDIRAKDIPHWPSEQGYAFIVRATFADHRFEGIDLSMLGSDLQPDRLVTAKELAEDGVDLPMDHDADMFLPIGNTPTYLGHAVAMLIYNDFTRYRKAKAQLKFRNEIVKYGERTGLLQQKLWATFRYVRSGGATSYEEDQFSSLKNSPLHPIGEHNQTPIWPKGRFGGSLTEEGVHYADLIDKELSQSTEEYLVFSKQYSSQSTDGAAPELDNTNAWYDSGTQTLHLIFPSQSPQQFMFQLTEMLTRSKLSIAKVLLHPCSTVGFGTKESYIFPFYGVIAALYGEGRPIRLANDRFEQFQTSLKRHPFDINYSISVNRKTGEFKSFKATLASEGGGRVNLGPSVVMIAATAANNIYYMRNSDVQSTVLSSQSVGCGSVRGFGALQSLAATEMFIDELAQELKLDPIALRLRNVIKTGMKNAQGAIPAGAQRTIEVLERAAQHSIWVEREKRKKEFERTNPGKLYGVGVACVQKEIGNGAEAIFARVELDPQGKITLYHTGIEIGTGVSTSQSVVCKRYLGRPADEAHFGVLSWDMLPIELKGKAFTITQEEQDEYELNPRWSPNFASSSSASNSAYFYTHATEQATRLIFDYGLWPAALAIWRAGIGGGQAEPHVIRKEDAHWTEKGLSANGMEPLSLERLVKKTIEIQGVTGVTIHAFNRSAWAYGDFEIDGKIAHVPLDAIALQRGGGGSYQMLHREKPYYPPIQRKNVGDIYYSSIATLVEIAVNTVSSQVEVLRHHTILECGAVIVPELVAGQIEGGTAMGIGHALYEYLPLYEDGPGSGRWNFNRYQQPLAKDVAVWAQTHEVLAPITESDPAKGVAEIVMIPIVAAIVNAVADATGHRFRDLPIRPEDIRKVLS